jgi:hypothetical protein
MSGNSNQERLEGILATCIAELLTELSPESRRVVNEHKPLVLQESLAAFSGFGSTDFRGSLTLLGSVSLFSQLHPLPSSVTPRDLADWACELVNQMAGRYRNRLLDYDVSLALGVPQSALAHNMRLSSSLRPMNNPICFTIHGAVLEIWLEVNIRPDFRLADNPANSRGTALREGSIVFF